MFRSITAVMLLASVTAPIKAEPNRIDQAARVRDAALAESEAFAILEDLTTRAGQRLAGTPVEARARDWAVKAMRDAALVNIRTEPFPLKVWARGVDSVEIIGSHPQTLQAAALGYSGATPAQGSTAPVVHFRDYQALVDAAPGSLAVKIAFIDHDMKRTQDGGSYGSNGPVRRACPALAQSKGTAAVLIRSLGTDSHRNPHTGSTTAAPGCGAHPLDGAVAARCGTAAPVAGAGAGDDPDGFDTANHCRWPVGQCQRRNSRQCPGRNHRHRRSSLQLGPGNRGVRRWRRVAITLAAVKAIKDAGVKPRRTIRVVFWGVEELGLIGAAAYARTHAGGNIVLAGESDSGADRIFRLSSKVAEAGLPLVAEINRVLAPLGVAPTRENSAGGGPDVGALGALGVGILDLEQDASGYFDIHHTPDDTLDKVDRAQLDQNVAAWAAAVWLAASDDRPLRTK